MDKTINQARKVGIGILGGIVLTAGIVMIPYPGPGWLVVFAGLGILSTEFDWARRVLHFAKGKYDAWQRWLASQKSSVRALFWLVTAIVVVVTIWLLNGYGLISQFLGLNLDWAVSPLFR